MDAQYYIHVTLKTGRGLENIARFFIGVDKKIAYSIFEKLQRIAEVSDKDIIFMDFMETRNGLPLSVDMIACDLEQLGENCKTITKELFKLSTLYV